MSDSSRERSGKRRDEELISAGNQMSNVFFNQKQKLGEMLISNQDREMYTALQERWDYAKKRYYASFKRKKERP